MLIMSDCNDMLRLEVICGDYLQNIQEQWREERGTDISLSGCVIYLNTVLPRKTISPPWERVRDAKVCVVVLDVRSSCL